MGGVDVIRGMAFQQAVAVQSCLDVITSPDFTSITVEGADDVVDIALVAADGRSLVHKQVKSRKEPGIWSPAEIFDVVNDWFVQGSGAEKFEFVTNASLGPAAKKLIDTLGNQPTDPGVAQYLRSRGAIAADRLGDVIIRSRVSQTDQLLASASHRLCLLHADLAVGEATLRADRAIDRLFTELFVRGGDDAITIRTLTREELAAILEVDLNVVDSPGWHDGVRAAWIASATGTIPDVLSPLLHTDQIWAPALTQGYELGGERATVTDVASEPISLVVGASGTGKSMFCKALRRDAAPRGIAVIVIDALDIVVGQLPVSLSQALGAALGRYVAPSVGSELLADDQCIVAIDGLSEAGGEATAIADELIAIASNPTTRCRFLATGRDGPQLRELCRRLGPSAGFRMKPWGWEERDRALRTRVNEEDVFRLRHHLEQQLGAGAENPLIFSMATNLMIEGHIPTVPGHVYRDCVDALCQRNGVESSVVGVVLGIAFSGLINKGIRTATRFEWEISFRNAVASVERKTGLALDTSDTASLAWKSGLIATIGFTGRVSALHDSIAEFLAGAAVARGLCPIADAASRGTRDQLSFAVQMIDPIDERWALTLASKAPIESAALPVLPESSLTAKSPSIIAILLRQLAGPLIDGEFGVVLGRHANGTAFARIDATCVSSWTDESFIDSARRAPTRHVRDGNLSAALDLWAGLLRRALRSPMSLSPSESEWRRDPISVVLNHYQMIDNEVARLIDECFSESARAALEPHLQSPGIEFTIYDHAHPDLSVRYSRGSGTYRYISDDGVTEAILQSSTSVRTLLSSEPNTEACKLVKTAIEKAASVKFIRS